MMVVPTQCGEIVWVGSPALGPGDTVVGLEPVSGDTSVGCAATIPVEDESSKFGWDDPGGPSHTQRLSVGGVDVFD